MPFYDYKCPECSYNETVMIEIKNRNKFRMCPKCLRFLVRQLGNVGFDLKGEGFYCNEYKEKNNK